MLNLPLLFIITLLKMTQVYFYNDMTCGKSKDGMVNSSDGWKFKISKILNLNNPNLKNRKPTCHKQFQVVIKCPIDFS